MEKRNGAGRKKKEWKERKGSMKEKERRDE